MPSFSAEVTPELSRPHLNGFAYLPHWHSIAALSNALHRGAWLKCSLSEAGKANPEATRVGFSPNGGWANLVDIGVRVATRVSRLGESPG